MSNVLVLANQTLGGQPLLDELARRHQAGKTHFYVVVPQNRPQHGGVVYDDAVRNMAQLRLDLAVAALRERGYSCEGEIGDEEPTSAALDAIAAEPIDEIVVSTLPATASGWLKRDLVERLERESNLPVTHITVNLDRDNHPMRSTLVVANQTMTSDELLDHLKQFPRADDHRFIVVLPHDPKGQIVKDARARLSALLEALANAGYIAAGTLGDPDPYTATMNMLDRFVISDVVISTLPQARSRWMRSDLLKRVKNASSVPVEHVVSNSVEQTPA